MKTVRLADVTLTANAAETEAKPSFREKVEIVKQLDALHTDVIELSALTDGKADILFYKTVAPAVKNSIISCPAGADTACTETAYAALSGAARRRINVTVPVSAGQMEYTCKRKPAKVLEMIAELVAHAKTLCGDVEFTAEDAMRSDMNFLADAAAAAVKAGATQITVCDTAGDSLPEEAAAVFTMLKKTTAPLGECSLGFKCRETIGMAAACVFAAVNSGADEIKTSLSGAQAIPIETVAAAVTARGESAGIRLNIDRTGLKRAVSRMKKQELPGRTQLASAAKTDAEIISLAAESSRSDITRAAKKLGYELSKEDAAKVFEAFGHIAESKKSVSGRELEAIIASEAVQAPQTYKLISYVTNSGNIIAATANIIMEKNGEKKFGLCSGDGPIDAAFLAIEQIAGRHFELDDFQIQSVTRGREAVGEALVKLRHAGTLYSGRGTSTDIIGASIRAYVSALNKIVYEENGR